MDIRFTKRQYEVLMKPVHLGNWVVNGYRVDDFDEETDALENYVYGKARDFGLGDLVFYDDELDGWYPTNETEDNWLASLDDFKNDVFWDELEYRLADRDLTVRFGEDYAEDMKPEERGRLERELVDRYFDEFVKNGVKNLVLVHPS
jgi:hypothetical protein